MRVTKNGDEVRVTNKGTPGVAGKSSEEYRESVEQGRTLSLGQSHFGAVVQQQRQIALRIDGVLVATERDEGDFH